MQLRRIRIHPVKSLTGMDVQSASFTPSGFLRNDRRWCLVQKDAGDVTPDSVYMTKVDKTAEASMLARTRAHHGSSLGALSLELDGQFSPEFHLPQDSNAMSTWCSERFGVALRLEESVERGWPDVAVYGSPEECAAVSGPTVISTATLAYLGDRLDLSPNELLFRFRTNLLVHDDDLEPFGEDELTEITLGDVRLAVVGRVERCPVPGRDPTNGQFDRTFAKRFIEAKAASPSGGTLDRSELYTASVFTRVLTPKATLTAEPETETRPVDWNVIQIPSQRSRSAYDSYEIYDIQRESECVKSFYLRRADLGELPDYQPGQFLPIRVSIPGHDAPVKRTYTLSDAPGQEYYRLSIKREDRGLVSSFLHERAEPGFKLEAMPPRGKFNLDQSTDRAVVLLSAGIGVTPMIAMAGALASEGQRTGKFRRTYFIHGTHNGRVHAFAECVRGLASEHPSFSTLTCYSSPDDRDVLGQSYDVHGRIDVETLKQVLPLDDYEFYLCGPPPFMQSLFDGLIGVGIAEDRIRYEAFGPATVMRPKNMSNSLGESTPEPITVRFASSGIQTQWTPDKGTLLDLAEEAGLSPNFSCRSGVCGTCATRLTSGAVDYDEEPDAPIGLDEVLICCCRPSTHENGVTLDM